jgi:dihydropteroate synthase
MSETNHFRPFRLRLRGEIREFTMPVVMGILNITPDSFHEGSRISDLKSLGEMTNTMLKDGAAILDIGGQSTRPGAQIIDTEEEWRRLELALTFIRREFPDTIISVDTFSGMIAERALDLGCDIVNDVFAWRGEEKMREVISKRQVPYVLMHSRGDAQTMNNLAVYEDILGEMIFWFSEQLRQLRSLGVHDIIIDPGFGFAKNEEQNLALMRGLSRLQLFECPILVGISRKRFIRELANSSIIDSLNATTAAHMRLLAQGAAILRVHDVKAAKEAVEIHLATI